MKKPLKVFLALLASVSLSSCSTSGGVEDFFDPGPTYTAENPGFGINGDPLPDFNYFGGARLADADIAMSVACQNLDGFETGTIISNGEDLTPEPQVLKTNFRTYAVTTLDIYKDDYPELEIYYQGAIEKLADPSSNPEGYRSFKEFCAPYIALAKRTDEIWTEPVKVDQKVCWDGVNVRATLQVRLDGSWLTINSAKPAKDPLCDSDYPYSISVEQSLYGQSHEMRWLLRPADGYDTVGGEKEFFYTFSIDSFGAISNWVDSRDN